METSKTQKLSASSYNSIKKILMFFDTCLRNQGVFDKITEIEQSEQLYDSNGKLIPKFTNGNYGTKQKKNALSKLCKALIFGPQSPSLLWSALHKGSTSKPKSFKNGVDELKRFFGKFPHKLEFHLVFSMQLMQYTQLRNYLEAAEFMFLKAIKDQDVNNAYHLLTNIDQLRPPANVNSPEFKLSELDAIVTQPCELPNIYLNDDYKASAYTIFDHKNGSGLWSHTVSNALILTGPSWKPSVTFMETEFESFDRRIGWKKLVEAQRSGAIAFNTKKLGLRTDILLINGNLPTSIELQPCDYIDNLSTNDIAKLKINELSTDIYGAISTKNTLIGSTLFCDQHNYFIKYSDSKCSNQIGVSTLAITDDGVPLLIHQLKNNLQSNNLTAPSGSGSLDYPIDFIDLENGQGFGEWLLNISQRELREELGIQPFKSAPLVNRKWMEELDIKTMFVGFGSLVHRGGKPDFFFLARLHCNLTELLEHHYYDMVEKRLSAHLADIRNDALPNLDANSLKIFCENQKVVRQAENSVPLALLYEMIIYATEAHEPIISRFLMDQF